MNNFQEYLVSEKLINEIDNPVYKNMIKLGNQNLRDFKTEISKVSSPVELKILSDFKSGSIDIPSLGNVLMGMQKFYTYSYNYLLGNKSIRGKIAESVKSDSSLIITGTSPGSFIVALERKRETQLNIEEFEKNELHILDDTFDALKNDTYRELFSRLGYRSYKALKEWYSDLEKNDIEFQYKNNIKNINIDMYKSDIKKIKNNLETIEPEKEKTELNVEGKIDYVNHNSNSIHFKDLENKNYIINITGNKFKDLKIKTNVTIELGFREIREVLFGNEIAVKYECDADKIEKIFTNH